MDGQIGSIDNPHECNSIEKGLNKCNNNQYFRVEKTNKMYKKISKKISKKKYEPVVDGGVSDASNPTQETTPQAPRAPQTRKRSRGSSARPTVVTEESKTGQYSKQLQQAKDASKKVGNYLWQTGQAGYNRATINSHLRELCNEEGADWESTNRKLLDKEWTQDYIDHRLYRLKRNCEETIRKRKNVKKELESVHSKAISFLENDLARLATTPTNTGLANAEAKYSKLNSAFDAAQKKKRSEFQYNLRNGLVGSYRIKNVEQQEDIVSYALARAREAIDGVVCSVNALKDEESQKRLRRNSDNLSREKVVKADVADEAAEALERATDFQQQIYEMHQEAKRESQDATTRSMKADVQLSVKKVEERLDKVENDAEAQLREAEEEAGVALDTVERRVPKDDRHAIANNTLKEKAAVAEKELYEAEADAEVGLENAKQDLHAARTDAELVAAKAQLAKAAVAAEDDITNAELTAETDLRHAAQMPVAALKKRQRSNRSKRSSLSQRNQGQRRSRKGK